MMGVVWLQQNTSDTRHMSDLAFLAVCEIELAGHVTGRGCWRWQDSWCDEAAGGDGNFWAPPAQQHRFPTCKLRNHAASHPSRAPVLWPRT